MDQPKNLPKIILFGKIKISNFRGSRVDQPLPWIRTSNKLGYPANLMAFSIKKPYC